MKTVCTLKSTNCLSVTRNFSIFTTRKIYVHRINHFPVLRARVAMENEKSLKNDFIKNYLINDIDFDANKHDLKNPFLLSKMEDKYSKDESLPNDGNDLLESDEYDYDSDCSLGSTNSLYLRLKDDRIYQNSKRNIKHLQQRNNNFYKTDEMTTNTIVTSTRILEVRQFNGNIKYAKSVGKLNAVFFYGKQKSITQHVHTKLSFGHQRKKMYMNSKNIKSAYTICKFKPKSHKLRISLKKRQYKKHSIVQKMLDSKNVFKKNENLLRYKLKEHIPLLQLKGKIKIGTSQKSENYSIIHKNVLEHEKNCITDYKTIKNKDCSPEYCYIENRASDSNSFFTNEFMDFDDLDCTKVVGDIIEKLFNEDDSITDNLTMSQNN